MKGTIKTLAMVGMVFWVLGGFTSAKAQCSVPMLVANWGIGAQYDVVGTPDDGSGTGSIQTRFWIYGASALHNSGSLPTTYQLYDWGLNSFVIFTDWGNTGVVGDCPSIADRTVFAYSLENLGAGQYILVSVGFSSYNSAWDFDAVTNGNGDLGPNTEKPIAIPAAAVASQSTADGVVTLNLTWDAIQNLKGFYDTDPGSNLITGVAIRYYQGASAPSSYKTADWNVAGLVSFGSNGSDPGQATIQVPEVSGLNTYLAMTVLFDGGQPGGFTETSFVGANTLVATTPPPPPPVVQPIFTSVRVAGNPRQADVAWTATNESSVTSYVVMGASSSRDTFAALTGEIPVQGGKYSVTLDRVDAKYFMVQANLSDGTTVDSQVATFEKKGKNIEMKK